MRFYRNKNHTTFFKFLLGGLIYAIGDTTASILIDKLDYFRILGVFTLGATLYAFEMPKVFNWIESKVEHLEKGVKRSIIKTLYAMLYFNPLWIARHLALIMLFSGEMDSIGLNVLKTSCLSFVFNIPLAFIGNYTIQNKVPLNYRFIASAVFSAVMAIYYAMSTVWFN